LKGENAASLKPMKQAWQRQLVRYVPYIILGVILLIWPPFMGAYVRTWITQVLIYGIFAVSLNLIFGYSGLFPWDMPPSSGWERTLPAFCLCVMALKASGWSPPLAS